MNEKQNSRFVGMRGSLRNRVAIYLAFTDALLQMEQLGVRVNDAGFTVIDETA